MNGTILGMTKREIDRKFEQIVEFSGVAKFLDTPVKRYSSGMTVRLAFAVAAHLEPEILIIDEVLAVGDFEFQRKCLGKMHEVAGEGRTVLFVSHNMAAVQGLCTRAVLVHNGRVEHEGEVRDVIRSYMAVEDRTQEEYDLRTHQARGAGYAPVLQRLRIQGEDENGHENVRTGATIRFDVYLHAEKPIRYLRLAIRILNPLGQRITTCHSDYQQRNVLTAAGDAVVTCRMKNCRLPAGLYLVELQVDDGREIRDHISGALTFRVESSDVYGTGKEMPSHAALFLPEVDWSVTEGVEIR
jgi:lipopolysaccharide transport system ATP-binding protein